MARSDSCQQELSTENGSGSCNSPDLPTQVKSSVSVLLPTKRCTCEWRTVQFGTALQQTLWLFEAKNVQGCKNCGFVTVSKIVLFQRKQNVYGNE